MYKTNLDTLLFCGNLLRHKLLQVSEYGPRITTKSTCFQVLLALAYLLKRSLWGCATLEPPQPLQPRRLPCRVARWHIWVQKNHQFGYFLEGLGMKNVGVFYCRLLHFTAIHMVHFAAIWYIYYLTAVWCGHLVYFVPIMEYFVLILVYFVLILA
jgi:hypothetical protein